MDCLKVKVPHYTGCILMVWIKISIALSLNFLAVDPNEDFDFNTSAHKYVMQLTSEFHLFHYYSLNWIPFRFIGHSNFYDQILCSGPSNTLRLKRVLAYQEFVNTFCSWSCISSCLFSFASSVTLIYFLLTELSLVPSGNYRIKLILSYYFISFYFILFFVPFFLYS